MPFRLLVPLTIDNAQSERAKNTHKEEEAACRTRQGARWLTQLAAGATARYCCAACAGSGTDLEGRLVGNAVVSMSGSMWSRGSSSSSSCMSLFSFSHASLCFCVVLLRGCCVVCGGWCVECIVLCFDCCCVVWCGVVWCGVVCVCVCCFVLFCVLCFVFCVLCFVFCLLSCVWCVVCGVLCVVCCVVVLLCCCVVVWCMVFCCVVYGVVCFVLYVFVVVSDWCRTCIYCRAKLCAPSKRRISRIINPYSTCNTEHVTARYKAIGEKAHIPKWEQREQRPEQEILLNATVD